MTLKELAYAAQQTVQSRSGCAVKRSHVHELLAAAFGRQSWAAFLTESVLADGGIGNTPEDATPRLIGRAVQLQYAQAAAVDMAAAMLDFIKQHHLSTISWSRLSDLLTPPSSNSDDDDNDNYVGDDDDSDDDQEELVISPLGLSRDALLLSPRLLLSLEHAAEEGNIQAHHMLAALLRCSRPNSYLYDESLKGRTLNVAERQWADAYPPHAKRFAKYETHLKAAAHGGVRSAALEYAEVFDSQEFFELAERLSGDVDPLRMSATAADPMARARWLRDAAKKGSRSALEQLAERDGDEWAMSRLAESGDPDWLRTAAEHATANSDSLLAWTWQYLALEHGIDLTKSTMAAYHDGGDRDGDFYDSDFGGPLYAAGEEALELPSLGRDEHQMALTRAREIFKRSA